MEPQDIRQLASDIVDGRVFTSWHIAKEDLGNLGMIFMPLLFMSARDKAEDETEHDYLKRLDEAEKNKENARTAAMFYEFLDQAGLRCINGYPMFMSLKMLRQEDAEPLRQAIREYQEFKTKWQNGNTASSIPES